MLRSSRSVTLALLTILLALCSPLAAGQDRWTQLGPTTAYVYNVVADPADPAILWISTGSGGVFRSGDGGSTWESRSKGITNDPVYQVELDPNDPQRMWAVGFDALYDSQDGGASWQAVTGCGSAPPFAMAVDPRPNGAIWVVTWTEVVVSRDRGSTWTVALPRSRGSIMYPVAVGLDPSDPDRVFVLDQVDILFHSDDSGETWAKGGTGIWDGFGLGTVVIDPTNPERVLCTAYDTVEESLDSGASFHQLATLPVTWISELLFDISRPGVLLAPAGSGLWRSTDGGATWLAASVSGDAGLGTVNAVGNAGALVGGGSSGIFRSGDGGATWSGIGPGPGAASVSSLIADPRSPTALWAGTWNRGVYHSSDCGASWTWMAAGPDNDVTTLAVDPLDPATIYAGTYSSGMMKTTDGGATWTYVFELPLKDWGVLSERQIMLKPSGQRRLWLVTQSDGIHWSEDGGESWTKVSSDRLDHPYALVVDPFDPAVLLATAYRYGVLRSVDDGDTWESVNTGLDSVSYVDVLAADPSTPGVFWAGARDGRVVRTDNRGDSWQPLAQLPSSHDVTSIRLDPAHPMTAWVATDGDGAFATHNGGASWSPVGLRPRIGVLTDLLGCGNALLAASDGGGVWSWEPAPPRRPSGRARPPAATARDAARSGRGATGAGQ